MAHRPFKQRLYKEFARIGNALASDRRLELLDLLAQGPRHVEALAAEAEMPVANVSQHLQILRQARLVEAQREGTKVLYRLANKGVLDLWLAVRSVAEERLAEVDQLTREYAVEGAGGPALSRDELERLLRGDGVLLIDTRPAIEFEHGHLPGAATEDVRVCARQGVARVLGHGGDRDGVRRPGRFHRHPHPRRGDAALPGM